MRLTDLAAMLQLQNLTPELDISQREVRAGYVSDLLSDVLAHAPQGGVLVTVQVHLNVIAVAVHAELLAVVFALGREPDPAVRARAIEEGIALFVTPRPAWEVVGTLHASGIRGESNKVTK
jgi:hypothetical protein